MYRVKARGVGVKAVAGLGIYRVNRGVVTGPRGHAVKPY